MSDHPPPPPWHTHGWAIFRADLVRAADLRLPPGLEVEARFGFTVGLLGWIEYRAPSPLEYSELVWMPARVRARTQARLVRGYFVAKMAVDHEGSLRAGREIWALPKERARFSRTYGALEVELEDGARVRLSLGRSGLSVPLSSSIATVQVRGEEIVRFRADTRARVAPRAVRVESEALGDGWQGFASARALGPLGAELRDFETTMQPPRRFSAE